MTDVFISYVHEDQKLVSFLTNILELNDIKVWLDKDNLSPGMRWKNAIQSAIQNGTYFLSIYSKARETRDRSYANEELVVAIDEIRRRPIGKPWFIPVKIDDCEIEGRPIGGGETILDLQICDLTQWAKGLTALLSVLGVEKPITDLGQPLSNGLPSFVKIQSGYIQYDHMDGLPEMYQGMQFRIDSGWCQRINDGRIMAYIETVAPFTKFQKINKILGLSGFHAISKDKMISDNHEKLSEFKFNREYDLPAGSPLLDIASGSEQVLPVDIRIHSDFSAVGSISDFCFSGTFTAFLKVLSPIPMPPINMNGEYKIVFEPEIVAKPPTG